MRVREEDQKPQINPVTNGFFKSERTKAIFWNFSSEMISVYLWFLRFSNVLLKLVQ